MTQATTGDDRVCVVTEYRADGSVVRQQMTRAEFKTRGLQASEIGSRVSVMWTYRDGGCQFT